jgi:hypothetical protein
VCIRLSNKPSTDKDALHILPLGILPLRTVGLRQARMIKNSQLQGVIELFRGQSTGSGQISPDDLPKVFEMGDDQRHDLSILNAISTLPSFDVYSLRIELRRLKIDVDDQNHLKLSAKAQAFAEPYMLDFTRPLMDFLRQGSSDPAANNTEILSVLSEIAKASTRNNFIRLAQRLEIELIDIPKFLEDYRDVYLSLAYYASCSDTLKYESVNTLSAFKNLRSNPSIVTDQHVTASMSKVERCLEITSADIQQIVADFKHRTQMMWNDITAERFQAMRELVMFYQLRLGAALCAASAKVHAWDERFPPEQPSSPTNRAAFIRNDMATGLDTLRRIPKLGIED